MRPPAGATAAARDRGLRGVAGRRRHAAALLATIVAAGALAGCGGSERSTLDTGPYVGRGNVADCDTFTSQADAQAVLRAEPTDRNGLDLDGDGLACPELPEPRDDEPVERIVITDMNGAPIDPDHVTARRKRGG